MSGSIIQRSNAILAIAIIALTWNVSYGSADSGSLFNSPQAKHNIMSYSLPRIGLRSNEDCNLSIYKDEFNRDFEIMKQMGVNTVHLFCPWSTDVLVDHSDLLKTLVEKDMRFIISLRTDIYQIEQRGGEKSFQDGMYVLADELAANPDAAKLLKGISIQYNLTGETASYFFQFVNKVKFWMNLLSFEVPLLVPWVSDISLEDKEIETQLTQWNSASFDAWVTHLYTPGEIKNYIDRLGEAKILKQVFILYGWDSYSTLNNFENQAEQEDKIRVLREYITITLETQDKNNTILGSSVFSFSDIYYMAEDEKYVYGEPSATCPDVNPWLQTSCGRKTNDVANQTDWVSDTVSIEIMGLFEHYETISLMRCVRPKQAAYILGALFLDPQSAGMDPGLASEYCALTITNPLPKEALLAPFGVAIIAVFISFILCCINPTRVAPMQPKNK
eukprot:TRINITY_DN3837_c0_g1_i1.p1 TRINITY_DN3837_c0_g1~~TRINITY_DN3837_c0_g1_i1.p1  ORF type:complete len:446 (+),score=32.32 TRINITY_DN3837_c0_g1_i1:21-1358(+)